MNSTDKNAYLAELNSKIDNANTARIRLIKLFDEDSFVELDAFMASGENEAGVVAGYGLIDGSIVYAYSQDVTANNGAVNAAHAKKIKKVYKLAAETGCPIVAVYDSKGAKIDEGMKMLAAYSKMLMWSNNLSGVVPQIALVLGTCGGVSAMLAAGADVVIMSKEAEMFMTAPFVAKANGDATNGAGSAENAAKAGVASIVCDDEDSCISEARKLISILPQNNLSVLPIFEYGENAQNFDPEGCPKLVVEAIADEGSAIELNAEYGKGVYTYLGTLAGITTGIVTTSKSNPLDADACSKTARFVKLCDAFSIPVITFIDSVGFVLNSDVAIVKEAAKLASAYAEATTAKVSVITGKAYGPAYIAMGSKNSNADITIAWPQAQISSLAPETAADFLYGDKIKGATDPKAEATKIVEDYINNDASPFEAAKAGYIEAVVAPEATRATLINMLDMLSGKRTSKLAKKHTTV